MNKFLECAQVGEVMSNHMVQVTLSKDPDCSMWPWKEWHLCWLLSQCCATHWLSLPVDSLFSSLFPLPPWRVASSIGGKDGAIFSWPISLNIGTHHHCLPLSLFFLPFLVLIGIRSSQHAGPFFFFVSKFPHRRFYSSFPVTLPTSCSVPALRQGCFVAARRTCLDSLPSETD